MQGHQNCSLKSMFSRVVPFKKLVVFLNRRYIAGVNMNLENHYGTK